MTTHMSPGSLLAGRYRVERLLGSGAHGAVYSCIDLGEGGRHVAVKVLHTTRAGAGAVETFRREFSVLSRLRHPNLTRIFELGRLDSPSLTYVVQEHVDGLDLLSATTAQSVGAVLRLFAGICSAVGFLHDRGVLHRDLKPSNVLVRAGGPAPGSFKLLDFGLASSPSAEGTAVSGTPVYTAPELFLGLKAGPQADLYSLGVLLFEVLARKRPFEGGDASYLIQKQLQGRVDLREIESQEHGPGIARVLAALLEKDPAKRPASAVEVVRLMSVASGIADLDRDCAPPEVYFSAGAFTGRGTEMALLEDRAEQVRKTGRGWTVFLSGQSGTGKTRLVDELRIRALLDGWRVVEGACTSTDTGSYEPYRQVLARLPKTSEGVDSKPEDVSSLDALLDVPAASPLELPRESTVAQFRDQLTRELVRRLKSRPTMVLLHDYQWADEGTTTVLDYLTSDVLAHPIFLCVSLRSDEREPAPVDRLLPQVCRQTRGESVTLGPLSSDEVSLLIANTLGSADCVPVISHWILRAVGGNPLFVEHALRHLVDRRLLVRQPGGWQLTRRELDEIELPVTIAAVVKERIERVGPVEREILEWLAVANRPLSTRLLERLVGPAVPSLDAPLADLESRQMIRRCDTPDQYFEPQHSSVSEVVRAWVEVSRLREMHLRFGSLLEGEADTNVLEIALHLTEGDAGERAVEFARKAAARSKTECSNEMTLRFSRYILGTESRLPVSDRAQVALDAAEAACALGKAREGRELLDALNVAGHDMDPDSQALLLAALANCHRHLGDERLHFQACQKGLSVLEGRSGANTSRTRTALLFGLAHISLANSRINEGLDFLDSATREILGIGELLLQARIKSLQAAMYSASCDFRRALRASLDSIRLLGERPFPSDVLSAACSMHGSALHLLGRFRHAIAFHERAAAEGLRSRSLIHQVQALSNWAECCARAGELAVSQKLADEAVRLAMDCSNPTLLAGAFLGQVEVFLSSGQYWKAQDVLDSLPQCDDAGLPIYISAHELFLRGLLAARLGRNEDARRFFQQLHCLGGGQVPLAQRELGAAHCLLVELDERGHVEKTASEIIALADRANSLHMPYHKCLLELEAASLLLTCGETAKAGALIRRVLRLSEVMHCSTLTVQAQMLAARVIRLAHQVGSSVNRVRAEWAGPGRLSDARDWVSKALERAERTFGSDFLWPIYLEAAKVEQAIGAAEAARRNYALAAAHVRKASLEVPSSCLAEFLRACGRTNGIVECEDAFVKLGSATQVQVAPSLCLGDGGRIILQHASRVISHLPDQKALLENLVDLLIEMVGMERAMVFLRDESTGHLRFAHGRNVKRESLPRAEAISRKVLEEVNRSGRPFVTANAQADSRISSHESVLAFEIGTLFCGPLESGSRILGVVYADHSLPLAAVGEQTINLFASCCELAAVALSQFERGFPAVRSSAGRASRVCEPAVVDPYPEIVGRSPVMQSLRELIGKVAASPIDVVILGESGTGKDLVARAIHRTSSRAKGPFVAEDCGSLSETLFESEFFGYRKGAFTGALDSRQGLLESADGGTVFLDELANLTLATQAKLLRVLEERKVRRLGENTPRAIDVRIIVATNQDLLREVNRRRFRHDLYYRFMGAEIVVPPLRERGEDVRLLADHFLSIEADRSGGPAKSFSPRAMSTLEGYSFPGNVRELLKIVRSSYYMTSGSVIDIGDLQHMARKAPREAASQASGDPGASIYRDIRAGKGTFADLVKIPYLKHKIGAETVRSVIALALGEARGRYRDALAMLGVPRSGYAPTIAFLKRHGCYLDFRPFRNPGPGVGRRSRRQDG